MEFLVDVNISRSKKFIKLHPEFTNSTDDLETRAIDDRVLQRAKDKGKVLVTRDKRLVIKALIEGVRVWYFDSDNVGHPLEASEFARFFLDLVSFLPKRFCINFDRNMGHCANEF